jgi:hypothetical protein
MVLGGLCSSGPFPPACPLPGLIGTPLGGWMLLLMHHILLLWPFQWERSIIVRPEDVLQQVILLFLPSCFHLQKAIAPSKGPEIKKIKNVHLKKPNSH